MSFEKFEIEAKSPAELLAVLSKINIFVPSRENRERKYHIEQWTIARFLGTYATQGLFTYPLTAIHDDGPDLRLKFPDSTCGVEVTQATDQTYQHTEGISAQLEMPSFTVLGNFDPNSPKRNKEQVKKMIHTDFSIPIGGQGSLGYQEEEKWAIWLVQTIDEKTRKLSGTHCGQFDRNWLLIHDSTPCLGLILDEALPRLRSKLTGYWFQNPGFGAIFIERNPKFNCFIRISPTETVITELKDVCQHTEQ